MQSPNSSIAIRSLWWTGPASACGTHSTLAASSRGDNDKVHSTLAASSRGDNDKVWRSLRQGWKCHTTPVGHVPEPFYHALTLWSSQSTRHAMLAVRCTVVNGPYPLVKRRSDWPQSTVGRLASDSSRRFVTANARPAIPNLFNTHAELYAIVYDGREIAADT